MEYINIEEAFINSKKELVLCDPSIKKNFYYTLDGKFIKTETKRAVAYYSMIELEDGGSVYYTGAKGNMDEKIQKSNIFMTTPDNEDIFFMPNEGELKIKILAADSYLIKNDHELLFHLPFRNKIYQIKNYQLFLKYEFDFGKRNLPEDAFFSINHEYFMQEYCDNSRYFNMVGSILASENFLIVPITCNKKLLGNIYYSRETGKYLFVETIIDGEGNEVKIHPRWIYKDIVAEITDNYHIYLTDMKIFNDSDFLSPTITFFKLKRL